ncbi:hypothetical protein OAT84_00470 [Gammaproteobacteria bacterium]|nr:hypothetical protein [Gammaproteobacteria bacterium]
MYHKIGLLGHDQATFDIANILGHTPNLEVHLVGDQSLLNAFKQIDQIRLHRSNKQVIQHSDTLILMDPRNTELVDMATHQLKLINITGLPLADMQQLAKIPSAALISLDIGLSVKQAHSLLAKSQQLSNEMAEKTEQIMRTCGSIQWVDEIEQLHMLSHIGMTLPLLTLVLSESANMHLTKAGISENEAHLLTKSLFSGIARFMQTHDMSAELLNQSSQYLNATNAYLKVATVLKSYDLDKILSQCFQAAEQDQKINQLESGSNSNET